MSGLVYIGMVQNIIPMDANLIESLTVDCGRGGQWQGVAKKGEFSIGTLVEVYLQDSLLPHIDAFAFMEKYNYWVRMVRLRGIPSECLIMPLTVSGSAGDDITELVNVTKYEKPLPTNIGGEVLGHFPPFILKTDEPNFQSVPEMVRALQGKPYYATIKVDGCSATSFKWQGHFGICSRNYELKPSESNTLWQVAQRYELERKTLDGYAIQWEAIGQGIQGNPLGLKITDMQCFNVYDITSKTYLNGFDAQKYCGDHGLPFVESIYTPRLLFDLSSDDLRLLAEMQTYPNGSPVEGIVIRPLFEQTVVIDNEPRRVSFKVLNLRYKES